MTTWHREPGFSERAGTGVTVGLLDAGVVPHPAIPPIDPADYRIFAGGAGDATGHGTA
ncbi:MAG: hypothetical protein H0V89_04585, partial [Deltaproteobacteria bacterium]|nr:hypothetical protein [Deltaproteobacteria bacterium]